MAKHKAKNPKPSQDQQVHAYLSKDWFKSQPHLHKKWFDGIAWSLGILVMMIVIAAVLDERSGDYNKAHGALFVMSSMVLILVLIRKAGLIEMFRSVRRFVAGRRDLSLMDLGDVCLALGFLLSALSYLFVIDYDFIAGGGMRVGAVASIAIASLIKSLYLSYKR